MGDAKKIIIKIISSKDANAIIKKYHYSGKVVPNSKLHFGVFYNGKCGGALQYGPSMRKDLIQGLVKNTGWNQFLELNRMALADWMPKNGESRSISYTLNFIKKTYPHIKWVISFADGCQCGDGTIYRASGFKLIGIKKNTQIRINPENGKVVQSMTAFHAGDTKEFRKWDAIEGYMLRYIYFINKEAEKDLTVPIIPFSAIKEKGAGMYLGIKKTSGEGVTVAQPAIQQEGGGSIPTSPHKQDED